MPRPFLIEHRDPGRLATYVMRDAGELLDGNIPAWSKKDVLQAMQDGIEIDQSRFLHVTISMPTGLRLETAQWQRIFKATFRHLGLAIERLPFFVWRHSDTGNDHAEAMIRLLDFVGRQILLTGQGAACDRADLEISELLGLPRPHVRSYTRWTRPGLFHRRKKAAALPATRRAFDAINACLREDQPSDCEALATNLARRLPHYGISVTQSGKKPPEIQIRLPDGQVLGARALSNDLRAAALTKQFTLFRQVVTLRQRYSNGLLLFGDGNLFDHWLEKRKFADGRQKETLSRGAVVGVPENRGLPEGAYIQDRRGRRAPIGSSQDAGSWGGRESRLDREIVRRNTVHQNAAISHGYQTGHHPAEPEAHDRGTKSSNRLGNLIGQAAKLARELGPGWHPKILSSGGVGLVGPYGESHLLADALEPVENQYHEPEI